MFRRGRLTGQHPERIASEEHMAVQNGNLPNRDSFFFFKNHEMTGKILCVQIKLLSKNKTTI